MTRKERFWRWVLATAERKIDECHSHSRQCPNCGRWSAVAGVLRYRDLDEAHTGMTCGQCGYESRWDMVSGMLPLLAEPCTVDERKASFR